MKVIASSLRKGNIVELDNKLYVVLNAESFHPGKGTPTTQIDMRRISDGVKTAQRYKTTDQVERAHVEEQDFQFLYQDGEGFHFMNSETYDQITLSEEMVGDQAPYLQPEMKVKMSVYDGVPVSMELPQKVTLEVTETEPSIKSQTAASSYKPAMLSNGVRTMVPPFVSTGTRIVVMTADGFHFMNMENYDQVTLPSDIIGDQAVYLEPEMKVMLAVHENVPVSIELPQKATLEVVETEPTVKGQTASSSYKPAVLSNGVRTMVPPFVGTGTKIVVMTADGSYVERAKE